MNFTQTARHPYVKVILCRLSAHTFKENVKFQNFVGDDYGKALCECDKFVALCFRQARSTYNPGNRRINGFKGTQNINIEKMNFEKI